MKAEGDGEETPFDRLAERLGDGAGAEGGWEAFVERADGDDEGTGDGSSTVDRSPAAGGGPGSVQGDAVADAHPDGKVADGDGTEGGDDATEDRGDHAAAGAGGRAAVAETDARASVPDILDDDGEPAGGDGGGADDGVESVVDADDPAGPVDPGATDLEEALDEFIDRDDERLEPDDVRTVRDREYVVPTDRYCEDCEHFADPPDAYCRHEGTEILEFEDMRHVRVRDCPLVDGDPGGNGSV